jgi:hypothetical protein
MSAVIEVFTTPNKKTKAGLPLRFRWRLLVDDSEEWRSQHSFGSEAKALVDIGRNVRGFATPPILRRPGRDDEPWVPHV